MTQKIRKAIATDKSISPEGRRVKVTTQGGKVTLQGSALQRRERTSIFTKAADVAGGANVANNITILVTVITAVITRNEDLSFIAVPNSACYSLPGTS